MTNNSPMNSRQKNDQSPVESYFSSLRSNKDPLLESARRGSSQLGLSPISLGDLELSILSTLVRTSGARKFVEVGTLTGASGLAILSGLGENGQLWTFEKEEKHAALARPVLTEGARKYKNKVDLIVGDAEENLFLIEHAGPFDGIFIDGNKSAYGDYLAWAEKNLRTGGIVIADNVFLRGAVWGEESSFSPKQAQVMNQFNKRLMDPQYYESCIIPTSEGLLLALKKF